MVIAASVICDFFGAAVYPGSYCCKNKEQKIKENALSSSNKK